MSHVRVRLTQARRDLGKLMRLPFVPSRRFDICCCGLSKTGTHSMAGLFANYRSAHHPDAHARLTLAIGYLRGELDATRAQRTLRRRDWLLQLELESSSLAGTLIDALVKACPQKKFILTIRDVYSWCDSWLDHNINQPPKGSSLFAVLDQVRLRVNDFPPTKWDAPLIMHNLAPLACYFQLWAHHNAQVLHAVPKHRLLIVKTDEISDRIPDIAAWAGVSSSALRADQAWLFATAQKHRMLARCDPSYVRDTAQRFCGPLMKEYFAA